MMDETSYKTYEDLPLMISVPELAKAMGISRAGAYDLARRADFPKIKIGTASWCQGRSFWNGWNGR